MPRQYPEILEDLLAKLPALFVREGVADEAAPRLAFIVTEFLRDEWGGASIYIPRGASYQVEAMARDVCRRWNGRNLRTLARELGIGEARVRQLYRIGQTLARAERNTAP